MVVCRRYVFGETHDKFNVMHEAGLEQLVHDTVVIVVMSDAVQRLCKVPDSSSERTRIDVMLVSHTTQTARYVMLVLLTEHRDFGDSRRPTFNELSAFFGACSHVMRS